jgi:hypothetical protein
MAINLTYPTLLLTVDYIKKKNQLKVNQSNEGTSPRNSKSVK